MGARSVVAGAALCAVPVGALWYVYVEGGPPLYTWGHPPPLGGINVLHHRNPSTPVLHA